MQRQRGPLERLGVEPGLSAKGNLEVAMWLLQGSSSGGSGGASSDHPSCRTPTQAVQGSLPPQQLPGPATNPLQQPLPSCHPGSTPRQPTHLRRTTSGLAMSGVVRADRSVREGTEMTSVLSLQAVHGREKQYRSGIVGGRMRPAAVAAVPATSTCR